MARALVSALSDAGYDRAHITLVEVPRHLAHELETAQPADGWGAPIAVGGRQEPLAAYLYGADAIINVPFLKTHLLAGMSGCLKNLSHALIRHPGLFHDGGCAPYVGQVVGNKEVSDRLRLNVVTAFRIVTRNGPDATEDDLYAHGGLLLGFDPLAVDTLGLSVLTLRRAQLGLPGALRVPYLESAARLGVGRMERRELEHVLLKDGA
jgi:uncharacterized protein (DUF362 family)